MTSNYVVKGKLSEFEEALTLLRMVNAENVTGEKTFNYNAKGDVYFHFSADTLKYCFCYEDAFRQRGTSTPIDYLFVENSDLPLFVKHVEMIVSAKLAA